ncbi:M-phase inducer phosphatase 1-like [Dreissena polymorpha]|uniref:M-phase inducer phosphatase 1-like n=1 Tax=Dreissena polymorpha TaxID=45954 RepID=UPI0022647CDF|nr:M-phase inducer phosphatase 1-like [Dreissena polymorpha]
MRLRLFDDVTCDEISHEDLEDMMTPGRKACTDSQCTALKDIKETLDSMEFLRKSLSRRGSANDARKSLFPGKRSAETDVNSSPIQASKKARDCSDSAPIYTLNTLSNDIMQAVETLELADKVADGSRDYTLPSIPGQHRDLRSISPEVMADVVSGRYKYLFSDVTIVDCRYPYEFEGGHIKGAVNLFTKDDVNALLHRPVSGDKRHVLIFHCEFSSERGPKMYRFLRSQDRELHKDQYPALLFPEVYLLHGGYKAFFNKFKNLCVPDSYKPMMHEDHSADLRHFRVKSKSWTAGEKQHESSRRHRSRLGRQLSFYEKLPS